MRRLKRLLWSIKNVISWIPILWNNFDWDESFLLRIMEFKLRKMSKYFKDKGIAANSKQQSEQCRIAAILCKRIAESNYNMYFWHRWIDSEENIFGMKLEEESIGLFDGQNEALDYEDYMRKQDLDYLCGLLKKDLFRWWD